MINYDWHIVSLERMTADGYVFISHYEVHATEGDISVSTYGCVGFERPEGSLIPYESLTEETVIGWTKEKLGAEAVEEIETRLTSEIEQLKQPKTAEGLPWPDPNWSPVPTGGPDAGE